MEEKQVHNLDPYSTHLPILTEIAKHIPTTLALEYGMGDFSTPFLAKNFDKVISIETQDEKWFQKVQEKYGVQNPNMKLLCSLDGNEFQHFHRESSFYSLVLCDGRGDRRFDCINLAFGKAGVIVAHDTEETGYQWNRVLMPVNGDFVWLDVTEYVPWTSVITENKELIHELQAKFRTKIRKM